MTAAVINSKTLRIDTKGRISLGKLLHEGVSGFKAFWDDQNRLILEPLMEVPLRERWIFVPEKLEQLDKAHQQAQAGAVHRMGSFQQHLDKGDA